MIWVAMWENHSSWWNEITVHPSIWCMHVKQKGNLIRRLSKSQGRKNESMKRRPVIQNMRGWVGELTSVNEEKISTQIHNYEKRHDFAPRLVFRRENKWSTWVRSEPKLGVKSDLIVTHTCHTASPNDPGRTEKAKHTRRGVGGF